MATTPDPTADDPSAVIETGKFIRRGKLLDDLTKEITAERPSSNAKEVARRLKISQVCDFKDQLSKGVADTTPTALGGYIKQYVRNNASDSTEIRPATMYRINPDSLASNRANRLMRRPGADSTFLIPIRNEEKIVKHLATKPPGWEIDKDGRIVFKQIGDVMINVKANLGVAFSDIDQPGPVVWRFSDTGTNRFVIITVYLELKGALSVIGETMRLALGEVVLFPEDITNRKRVPFRASTRFSVKDVGGLFGRVDSVSLNIERSTWVATSNGVQDGVGFFKQTIANSPDSSNYLEVIEL